MVCKGCINYTYENSVMDEVKMSDDFLDDDDYVDGLDIVGIERLSITNV